MHQTGLFCAGTPRQPFRCPSRGRAVWIARTLFTPLQHLVVCCRSRIGAGASRAMFYAYASMHTSIGMPQGHQGSSQQSPHLALYAFLPLKNNEHRYHVDSFSVLDDSIRLHSLRSDGQCLFKAVGTVHSYSTFDSHVCLFCCSHCWIPLRPEPH